NTHTRPRYYLRCHSTYCFFSLTHTPTPVIYTLSLHDALPISRNVALNGLTPFEAASSSTGLDAAIEALNRKARELELAYQALQRSEEHTSELQSRFDLVCRLLLEKKNKPSN